MNYSDNVSKNINNMTKLYLSKLVLSLTAFNNHIFGTLKPLQKEFNKEW